MSPNPIDSLWFDRATPIRAAEATVRAVAAAADYGLNPDDYDVPLLLEQWRAVRTGSAPAADRALFDVGLSIAGARILRAVHNGRVDPATMNWGYTIERKPVDPHALLKEVREGKGLVAVIESLEPPLPHYARAKRALAAYRALAAAGEPDAVPELPKGQTKVESGRTWAGLPQLVARLRVLGDLSDAAARTAASATTYSGPVVEAVRNFQFRHGLEVDGTIGAGTIKAINVPLAHRVRQIELAMERMRWLPALGKRPNVFVNVALFRLWATDSSRGEEPLRMNVVVGQSLNHKTPLFVEQMEYVVFRPDWNPPRGITVKELIPHARRDPLPRSRRTGNRGERRRQRTGAAGDGRQPDRCPRRASCSSVSGRARRTPWASPSSFFRTTRTSTCTERLRSSSSRAPVATSVTGVSGSRTRRASPSGCSAIRRNGRGSVSMPRCRGSARRASI